MVIEKRPCDGRPSCGRLEWDGTVILVISVSGMLIVMQGPAGGREQPQRRFVTSLLEDKDGAEYKTDGLITNTRRLPRCSAPRSCRQSSQIWIHTRKHGRPHCMAVSTRVKRSTAPLGSGRLGTPGRGRETGSMAGWGGAGGGADRSSPPHRPPPASAGRRRRDPTLPVGR